MASTYTHLLYHVVYGTKHRQPLIQPDLRERLYEYIGGIVREEGGTLVEIGGVADHVHLALRLRATPAVADVIKVVKAKSSKWVNDNRLTATRFAWQKGYAAFSVSPSQLERLVKYIRTQEQHHRRLSFKEELITLLEKHGIEYDERYVFE